MGDDNFQFVEMIGVFMNKKLVKEFLIISILILNVNKRYIR
jgi:hypothetical protein